MRLDKLLVANGLFASRSRARDAILRRTVRVDGALVTKPGAIIGETALISVDDPASPYVSRAALKLIAGLDHFAIDVKDCTALDIGASTGGFTQVLLKRGADTVIAVDVGHGQLHESLRADARVINLEMLNARELVREHLGGHRINLVVSDVSFISLKLALPPALDLAEPGSHCVLLIKPQFEAGRDAIGKGGILREPKDGERVANDLRNWLDGLPGWKALGYCPSPIEGGDGNREFLLTGLKATIEK
ncbi:TlyA family RNA methyltransferase [Phyllobacterium bourgognense]|uniref:23S rRNA (Cytidine1920-2'-O)/16S rRNA (Cytidine1409-2'-O)-methyltransferase n=1 Tax=Phyllobacterium bourgognense TaxID=314236 RepID=A0A368YFI3_9HYPH|nr:TlyA family RNA methyltransferase [Phyllobacterium bourgognense]RCW78208.1 23S rRNA (cytidine1920-2'-O)/16S rRNA (cytidine1409-2'-O)-methyltransferase [Phyllobacterium bourgognense]